MKEQTNGASGVEMGAWWENVWTVGAVALVVGLVVGFLIGWYSHGGSSQAVADDTLDNASSTETLATSTVPLLATTYQTIDSLASVSVDDQKAGSLVFIKHTEVTKPTWIAVREIVNDSVGNIIGAEMVTSTTDDVPVTLLRDTKAGQEYAVYLYQDNGDGKFDFKTDLLVMQNGAPVGAEFAAQ